MSIHFADLLKQVDPEVERRVRETRNRTRSILQEAVRTDCRLVMKSSAESGHNASVAQVSIEIAPGYPAVIEQISFEDDLAPILLVGRFRESLERTVAGLDGVVDLHNELSELPNAAQWVQVDEQTVRAVGEWAAWLLDVLNGHDPLETVLAVNEDILGVYRYTVNQFVTSDEVTNKASIEIYWGVVGLVSDWLGCSVEDLTIVVLTHELAHAYTQLGADIDGRRWLASAFKDADHALKEGLAQYYTERVLERVKSRFPSAIEVYRSLLPLQPKAYRTHLPWIEGYSPEAVRRAMLEIRRWREGKLSMFHRRLDRAEEELKSNIDQWD